MLNEKQKLNSNIFKKDIEKVSTRDGLGEGLVIAGEKDERVVVLTADLKNSTCVNSFAEKFPERFIQVGVAEQALVTIASGLAAYGKIPFATSFAIFSPGRNWEQIRTTIALNDVPVKIVGSHAGLSAGRDGGNHQMLEDIALMRVIPNMVVLDPIDVIETKKMVLEAAKNEKPTYIRVQRDPTPVITSEGSPFKIGRAEVLWETKSPEVAIIGCGPILYEALLAARDLGRKGIDSLVINSHTLKPLDDQAIIHAAKITGAIVSVEEHQKAGGLGGAVAEVLARNFPVPMEFIGMPDKFGESGKPKELLEKYGMKAQDIESAVKRVIKKKNT